MSALEWEKPPSGRGDSLCWISGCGKPRKAFVAATVRLPNEDKSGKTKSGYGRQVASKQHGFCKEHAEEVWAVLYEALEKHEGSRR